MRVGDSESDTIKLFVVYKSPSDFPKKWVVRCWHVTGSEVAAEKKPAAVVDDLQSARDAVPDGYIRTKPHPQDDHAIFEVWV